MLQECDHKVEDFFSKRDRLQVRLELTASQLSGICNSLTAARERLEDHRGCSATSHFRLESLLASSFPGLRDRVPCLGSDEVDVQRALLMNVVASASDRLEMV